jgi:putative SOS response-associated peptidase YedK
MCGRFTQHYTWSEVQAFLELFGTPRNLQPHYNIAPTTSVDVIRLDREGRRELVTMRRVCCRSSGRSHSRNCRRPSTLAPKASTRSPCSGSPLRHAAASSRPRVSSNGLAIGRTGSPHLFTAADGSPILAFAGLWDRWRDPASGDEVLSCTIVVSGASAWMTRYHDRMPVLLREEDIQAWLDGTMTREELQPAAESALQEWPVSKRVNRSGEGDGDPAIVEPAAPWDLGGSTSLI